MVWMNVSLTIEGYAADPPQPRVSPRNLEIDINAVLEKHLRTSHDNPMFEASLEPEAGKYTRPFNRILNL